MAIRYIFEDLIDIRTLREDRASQEAALKRTALEQALALVEQYKRELEEYRHWRIGARERLYDQVIKHVIRLQDLDRLKEALAQLDEKESLHLERIRTAEKAAEEARQAAEAAREAWRKAQASVEKLEEHREIWFEEAKIEEARREDVEMEEFGVRHLGAIGDELEY